MMNIKINSSSETEISNIKFKKNKNEYYGQGELNWDPKKGFKLKASLSSNNKLQGSRQFGGPRVLSRTWIQFDLNSLWKAIVPHAFIDDWDEIMISTTGKKLLNSHI